MTCRKILIAGAAAVLLSTLAWGSGDEDADGTGSGIAQLLQGLAEGTERAWAKPIEEVNMERMRELLEMGLVTFHDAEWYVDAEEDQ